MRNPDHGSTGLPLRTVYVTSHDMKVSASGAHLRFCMNGSKPVRLPLLMVRQLILMEGVPVSTGVIEACLDREIPVAFVRRNGELRGQLLHGKPHDPTIRINQVRVYLDATQRLSLATRTVAAKIANSMAVVRRHNYNHPSPELDSALLHLKRARADALGAADLHQLRGIEGHAARAYFATFAQMLRGGWPVFSGRNRQPPLDPVNAVLSFGYTLLVRECAAIIQALGLDSAIGFYHDLGYNRPALALDLVETLRAPAVDRFVLCAFNLGQLREEHFEAPDTAGAVYLNRDGRRAFLALYEDWLTSLSDELTGELWAPRPAMEELCESFRRAVRDAEIATWQPGILN